MINLFSVCLASPVLVAWLNCFADGWNWVNAWPEPAPDVSSARPHKLEVSGWSSVGPSPARPSWSALPASAPSKHMNRLFYNKTEDRTCLTCHHHLLSFNNSHTHFIIISHLTSIRKHVKQKLKNKAAKNIPGRSHVHVLVMKSWERRIVTPCGSSL